MLEFLQNPNNFNAKIQCYIARNLIVIALDRFADFLLDHSNLIVREISCQILNLILQ